MCVCGCMCTEYKLISHGLSFPPPPRGLILAHILTPVAAIATS
jgi:hypothetical protein